MVVEIKEKELSKIFDELFPICRSILGDGFRDSLDIMSNYIPFERYNVPSGTKIFDWTVPDEWHIKEAYIIGPDGKKYADFKDNNLSVVNYSCSINKILDFEELKKNIHTLKNLQDAVPYVTSYYNKNWGFCIPYKVYKNMPRGNYTVKIDSTFKSGSLTYGEYLLKGKSKEEVLITSYLCHPSLANNELSGPLSMIKLYQKLKNKIDRYYSYRFLIVPETIGTLCFLKKNYKYLQKNLLCGLVLTCVGGPSNKISFKKAKDDKTRLNKLIDYIKEYNIIDINIRDFKPEGSDERQYNSPGINLPVGQIARTVYGNYKEYHNSLDNKEFMNIAQVIKSTNDIYKIITCIDFSGIYKNLFPFGEPQLGKRDLYPSINNQLSREKFSNDNIKNSRNFLDILRYILAYSDTKHDIVDIAKISNINLLEFKNVIDVLIKKKLIERLS